MAPEVKEGVRKVTLSKNRQVSLASEFARAMRVKPKGKLVETLIRLPDGNYGVLLMRPPRSYSTLLRKALEGSAPADASAWLRELREEWGP